MTVNEGLRAEVFTSLKEAHGERIANAMMEMLPPAGVPELATKGDINVVRADLDILRAEVAGVEARLGEKLERALREQTTRAIAWMFSAVGLSSTIVAGITALQ